VIFQKVQYADNGLRRENCYVEPARNGIVQKKTAADTPPPPRKAYD